MAAAHPFGAFVSYRFKRIGCVRTIKVNVFIMCEISRKEYPNEMEKNSLIVIWVKSWHRYNASIIQRYINPT